MKAASFKNNYRKLLLLLIVAFFLTSCLEKSLENEKNPQDEQFGETIYITLTSAESDRQDRYLGTYQEVDGVILSYRRSDGLGDNASIELELVESNYGSATTTMNWTGAVENVIPGARYDFEAKAYTNGMRCYYTIYVKQGDGTGSFTSIDGSTYNRIENPDYKSEGCQNLKDSEPTEFRNSYPSSTNNYTHRQYDAYLFEGSQSYFKLESGNNDLQLRMSPILKPTADGQMIPYISKIDRPASYGPGDNVSLEVEFKGPQGFIIGLTGKVVGNCSIDEERLNGCTSINESFLTDPHSGSDEIIKLCPASGDAYWWQSNCLFEDKIITNQRDIVYRIPDNPPDEIRFEFVINLKNTYTNDSGTWTSYSGDLGLSNTIWFSMVRNSIDQTNELVFMPTVQDIAVYYDMSSNMGDLSYALQTQGVTDDIEIFANLEYEGSTPLGFPSPYLKLVNTGSADSQTLYGRMDKNELYKANLKLNFVHTPTGFEYTSQYPLPYYDKPKFGNMYENWTTFKSTGQCEHCLLTEMHQDSTTGDVSFQGMSEMWGLPGNPDSPFMTEDDTDLDPWQQNTPKIDGGSLAYSNLQGRFNPITYNWPYELAVIQYMELKNTSFLGTNLTNFRFNYVSLENSQFINSQINNLLIERSKIDGVIFSSDDGLPTTQNLPYTNLKFEMSSGDDVQFSDLTAKLIVEGTQFRGLKMNDNLIYQSAFDGFTATGEFKDNDVVESTFQNSILEELDLSKTSIVSTSIALSSLKNSDLSMTWFDEASGTDFYLVDCDEQTKLPVYGNVACRNGYLEFNENSNQEFVLDLKNDKNRASYLYEGDADSFKLLVENPSSIAVEVTSKSSDIQFVLKKSGSTDTIVQTSGDYRITSRTDGDYTTIWKYFSDFPPLADGEYFYVQVYGTTGVFYIISYYQEK